MLALMGSKSIERKIGCDRSLPSCANCERSGRECEGYNIRLTWPDQPDGRRKLGELVHSPASPSAEAAWPRHYGTQFLNVTSEDIILSTGNQNPSRLVSSPMLPAPRRSLCLHQAILGQEASLLSYCKSRT